jgi:ParB family transcriptional regulator, chromosome partitioning protein
MAKIKPLGDRFNLPTVTPSPEISELQAEIAKLQSATSVGSGAPLANLTLSPDRIQPSRFQPRRYFDRQGLEELTSSIRQLGILQPLVVRPISETDRYELIAGERRLRCAIAIELPTVPVVIKDLTDEQAYLLALHENIHREDLNPVDETEYVLGILAWQLNRDVDAVKSLLHHLYNAARGKVTYNVIGNEEDPITDNVIGNEQTIIERSIGQIGKGMTWQSFVINRLPLLNLPPDILNVIRQGKIEYTKAKAIARVKDDATRTEVLQTAIEEEWSLKQIRDWILANLPQTNESTTLSPQQEVSAVLKKIKERKVWENPQQWKKVKSLLDRLNATLEE